MSRFIAILLLISMILPIVTIPIPASAQLGYTGVVVKAGKYDFFDLSPIAQSVLITSTGSIRVVINRTALGWVGNFIRLSLILDQDKYNPNVGGFFFRISNVNDYGPYDPRDSPYGGVINIVENSTLTDIDGNNVGNVTVIDAYVIIWLKLEYFNLNNIVYITNVYTEEYRYEVLYNKLLRVKIFKAEAWDAQLSTNPLTIVEVFCYDVYINIYPYIVKYGDNTTLTFSFSTLFSKIYSITGISLNIEYNFTRVTMFNKYNMDEKYVLLNIYNGMANFYGDPVFTNIDVFYNQDTIIYTGQISEFAPSIDDPNFDYLVSTYGFTVEFWYVNESIDIFIVATSYCASTTYSTYLYINASLVIDPIEITGNLYTNPGDRVLFLAHNVPYPYLDVDYYVVSLRLINYTIFDLTDFLFIFYYLDGKIIGTVQLDELPYGGYDWLVRLIFNNNKYIEDDYLTIYPYILVYVLTNTNAYAEDTNGYYIGGFEPGDTSAPGDYIVIKGHGYDLRDPSLIEARFFDIGLIILDMVYNALTGEIQLLVKLLNKITYEPVPLGSDELFIGVVNTPNNAITPFNTDVGEPFKKVLFNPEWFRNATGYYIRHSKLGDPYLYFEVKYFDPTLDQIVDVAWPYSTFVEVIGWDSEVFVFKFYNKFFDKTYVWFELELVNGYGLTNLQGLEIPLLPYGDYTLIEETLASVNNRTVFTVYMSIDVDVDPCRDGKFNVTIVGGAPSTTYSLTFSYETYLWGTDKPYTIVPWQGEFIVTVDTDEYGYGFNSTDLRNIYATDMIINLTWYTLIYLNVNGTGTMSFWYKWNGTLVSIADTHTLDFLDPNSDTDFETKFYVNVKYNINVTLVSIEYIPRAYFVISVPEIVLPGDTIVVQIFPHKIPVYDLFIEPPQLFEETELIWGWYIYVRLVDPLTNTIVNKFEGYNVARVVEDVDGDDVGEIWFVVNLTAPFTLGVDKTYRVDVRVFLTIMEPYSDIVGVNVNDTGCLINIELNGTIYWRGLSSALMLGGDHQLVTVLGVLYGKIIEINNGVVYINATLQDLSKYIKINITEFLRVINETTIFIRDNVIEIREGVGRLETNITDLMKLVRDINESVTLILSCCRDVSKVLNRVEGTINTTYTYVMWINGNLTELIYTVNYEVLPEFVELYNKITLLINSTSDYMLENITITMREYNNSISTLIIASKNELNNTIRSLISSVIDKLTELYSNISIVVNTTGENILENITITMANYNSSLTSLIISTKEELANTISIVLNNILNKIDNATGSIVNYINESTNRVIGEIRECKENITSTLRLEINLLRTNLTNLINTRVDDLKLMINNNVTTILTSIRNVNVTILNELNETKILISRVNESIIATIQAGLFNLNTTLVTILLEIKNETLVIKSNVSDLISKVNQILPKFNELYNNVSVLINITRDKILENITIRSEEIFNKTMSILFEIKSDIRNATEQLIQKINTELLPKFTELYNNVSLVINATGEYILQNITANMNKLMNETSKVMSILLEIRGNVSQVLPSIIASAVGTILDKIDRTNASIIYYIDKTSDKIIGEVRSIVDDAVHVLKSEIIWFRENLTGLINTRVDDLKLMINNNVTTILTSIGSVNLTILNELNELRILLSNVNDSIVATIQIGIINLNTSIGKLVDMLQECCSTMRLKLDGLDTKVIELRSLIITVRDALSITIVGNITAIRDLLTKLSSDTATGFSDIETMLVNLSTLVRNTTSTLVSRIDNLESTLVSRLEAAAGTLSGKIDTVDRRQSEGFGGLSTNLSLFSITILLLEVVIIALIGYSLIRRPVG